MVSILVNNSTCQLKNSTFSIKKILKYGLRYKDSSVEYSLQKHLRDLEKLKKMDKSAMFSTDNLYGKIKQLSYIISDLEPKRYINLYKNDKFPTGLLTRVEELLKENNIKYEVIDNRDLPKLKQYKFVLKNNFPKLRYYQKEAMEACSLERGVLELFTGAGKSILINKLIRDKGVKTLIITPNKNINTMLYEASCNLFGKSKVEKITTKTVKTKKPILIGNIQALVKLKPGTLDDVSMLIIDEAHRSASDSYQQVNEKLLNNCYYRYLFTATFFRNDGADMALEAITGNILYEFSFSKAIQENWLTKPEFNLISFNGTPERTYQKEYKTNIVDSEKRNSLVKEIALEHQKDSTIILVKQIDHGNKLKELIKGSEFINGQLKSGEADKLLENFRKGKIKTLIGTDAVLGEGVDLPVAKVLIMANSGKAKSKVIQYIGRVLRLYEGKNRAIIYDFTDENTKWLEEHSNLRKEIYEQY